MIHDESGLNKRYGADARGGGKGRNPAEAPLGLPRSERRKVAQAAHQPIQSVTGLVG